MARVWNFNPVYQEDNRGRYRPPPEIAVFRKSPPPNRPVPWGGRPRPRSDPLVGPAQAFRNPRDRILDADQFLRRQLVELELGRISLAVYDHSFPGKVVAREQPQRKR